MEKEKGPLSAYLKAGASAEGKVWVLELEKNTSIPHQKKASATQGS